jgi:sulfite reductase alpha subunit-like flavoprotein
VVFKVRPSRDRSIVDAPLRPHNFEISRLKGCSELCPEGSGLTLTRYSVKLPEGLGYRTGARLVILPMNPPDIVIAVAEALGLEADQPYRLRASHPDPDMVIPEHVTARQLFERYVDLCGPPTRGLMKIFLGLVDDESREALHALIDPANETKFIAYTTTRTVADVICEYAPHGNIRIDSLLSGAPLTKPRHYAIASTPKKKRGYLDIIVEEHKFGSNPERFGLTSSYLRNVASGLSATNRVTMRIEDSGIEYPRDRLTPLIIIAVGVGISVAFGLLEFRKYNEGPYGRALLICEFPKRSQTTLIEQLLSEYVTAQLLDGIMWAYSDDPGVSCHSWQEAITENAETVWEVWVDDRSRVILAGRVGDAGRDLKEILKKMTMIHGSLRNEEASAWTDRHLIVIENFAATKTANS